VTNSAWARGQGGPRAAGLSSAIVMELARIVGAGH
jgi:hypothetical protein